MRLVCVFVNEQASEVEIRPILASDGVMADARVVLRTGMQWQGIEYTSWVEIGSGQFDLDELQNKQGDKDVEDSA